MLVRIAIAAFTVFASTQQALACSCLCGPPYEAGWKGWVGEADYVFRGTVLSTSGDDLDEKCQQPLAKCDDYLIESGRAATLKVTKLLKGKPADVLTVYTAISPSMCGVGFGPGQTADLLAFREKDDKLHVSACAQYCGRIDGAFKGLESGK